MTILMNASVGQIATEHPLATRVFHRYGIDFCCGGKTALDQACETRGLSVDTVIQEIRDAVSGSPATEERWDQASLEDLIHHILFTYHQPLHEELPRLEAMARRVLEVHKDKDPETLTELLSVFLGLKTELEDHMAKEEQILFPMIRNGQGEMADGPVSVMLHEHDSAAGALRRLRELTGGFVAPDGACNTWRALWAGLADLEESLHRHIHLENNILFPRALEGR